jgi:hypothetical protein
MNGRIIGQIQENTSVKDWQDVIVYTFDITPSLLSGVSNMTVSIPGTSCATHYWCDGYSIDYSELRIITE